MHLFVHMLLCATEKHKQIYLLVTIIIARMQVAIHVDAILTDKRQRIIVPIWAYIVRQNLITRAECNLRLIINIILG